MSPVNRKKLENLQDQAADSALRSRARIEAAVDAGDLPVWVLDTCDALAHAALLYGAARAKLAPGSGTIPAVPARH